MIPKVIYQTWKTQNLHKKINNLHEKMLKLNPKYKQIIYTDEQMLDFVKSNYDRDIFGHFERINNIVSRADFWRYLVLYKNGGVYLDIDSLIVQDLSKMIRNEDKAVITAEKNKNCYVQWSLVFDIGHPILEKTINNLIDNMINNRHKNDVLNFSVKPYWDAVNSTILENNLDISWDKISSGTDKSYEIDSSNVRFYGIDYDKSIIFKHKYNHLLRNKKSGQYTQDHWTLTQKEFDVYS